MTQKSFFRKKGLLILLLLAAGLVSIQFTGPRIDHPPVTADITVPAAVKQVLQKACYDCHSNETRLAWFDKIAPASWLVARHVKEGRQVLNFSTWDSLPPAQQKGKLFESLNQVSFGAMPLPQYTRLHPEARITAADIAVLKQYLGTLVTPSAGIDTAKQRAAAVQYAQWTQAADAAAKVSPAPNGVPFIPDYKNWQAISSSERFDNGTMRVILGNDVAVKAIRGQQIHPWPDGAVLAKVAWNQAADKDGNVHSGEFIQVELMIKDSHRYASTGGWGWGRWKGMQLQPYGKNALFVTECMNCHQPMQHNDLVFTQPLQLKNR
jgi:hypothetical protein